MKQRERDREKGEAGEREGERDSNREREREGKKEEEIQMDKEAKWEKERNQTKRNWDKRATNLKKNYCIHSCPQDPENVGIITIHYLRGFWDKIVPQVRFFTTATRQNYTTHFTKY